MNQKQPGYSENAPRFPAATAGVLQASGRLLALLCLTLCVCGGARAQTPGERGVEGPSLSPATGDIAGPTTAGPASKRPLGGPATTEKLKPLGQASSGGGESASAGLVRTTLSLGAVLLVIIVLAKVAKRLVGPKLGIASSLGPARAPSGILEILGRYPIGSGVTLLLLKVDRRVLVLSQSGSGKLALRGSGASLSTLCEIVDAEDVASILTKARDAEGESIAAKFRELLDKYSGSDEDGAPTAEPGAPTRAAQGSREPAVTVVAGSPRLRPIRVTSKGGAGAGRNETTEVMA